MFTGCFYYELTHKSGAVHWIVARSPTHLFDICKHTIDDYVSIRRAVPVCSEHFDQVCNFIKSE